LKESPFFGDFLSTIMKDDQPKKKKIKIAELKAKNKEEEEKERLEREKTSAAGGNGVAELPVFSFYRDTMEESKAGGEASMAEPPGASSPTSSPPREATEASPPPGANSPLRAANGSPADNEDQDLPFEEPRSDLPREVRGILVYARGAGRKRRSIAWPASDADLVQVEYFELDETERVNVNKLKFEEIRKREHLLEKNSMAGKGGGSLTAGAEEDSRPWAGLLSCDFEFPSIEYGGNSLEKTAQKQRENSVLQALVFNNRLPNDPSEPESAGFPKGVVLTHIPLEDESGEDAVVDYSGEGWPAPTPDEVIRPSAMAGGKPADTIYASIQQNLQNMMGFAGGAEDEMAAGMNIAMFAAQKAAEEALRQQGLLPPLHGHPGAAAEGGQKAGLTPPFPAGGEALGPEDDMNQPYEPEDMDYGGGGAMPPVGGVGSMLGAMQGPQDLMQAGGGMMPDQLGIFHNQQMGGGGWRGGEGGPRFPQFRGGGGRDFNSGPSGRDFRGGPYSRGSFYHGRGGGGGGGGFVDRHSRDRGGDRRRDGADRDRGGERGRGRSDGSGGGFPGRRPPCRFWKEKGFCRDEDRCRFPHVR
jgi:hypothetical protein